MLDIGFAELMVIGVVALVVLGPERLPRVARTTGHLLGRFQRYVTEVKADINREIELSELKKLQTSVEDAARSIETTVKSEVHAAEQELRSVQSEFDQAGDQIRKAQEEISQNVSKIAEMPHMGMGQVGAAGGEPAAAQSQAATSAQSASMSDDPASAQLELSLASPGTPEPVTAAPAKPS